MSMLTRCPACTSCYRVVPDQLRVSQGWVRCGQCAEIFDAQAHQIEPFVGLNPAGSSERLMPSQSPLAPENVQNAEVLAQSNTSQSIDTEQVQESIAGVFDSGDSLAEQGTDHEAEERTHPLDQAASTCESSVAAETENPEISDQREVAEVPGEPEKPDQSEKRSEPKEPESVWTDFVTASAESLGRPDKVEPMDPRWASHADPHRLSFLQTRDPVSEAKSGTVAWVLCVSALLVLLGFQWVVQDRDRLLTQFPQIRPALDWTCRALGCQLMAMQDIDALVIDASNLTVAGESSYRMNLKIKNTSKHSVAFPAVELTLLDALDQVLVRKVVMPADVHPVQTEPIGAGQAVEVRIGMTLRDLSPAQRVVGYRLTTFYL